MFCNAVGPIGLLAKLITCSNTIEVYDQDMIGIFKSIQVNLEKYRLRGKIGTVSSHWLDLRVHGVIWSRPPVTWLSPGISGRFLSAQPSHVTGGRLQMTPCTLRSINGLILGGVLVDNLTDDMRSLFCLCLPKMSFLQRRIGFTWMEFVSRAMLQSNPPSFTTGFGSSLGIIEYQQRTIIFIQIY